MIKTRTKFLLSILAGLFIAAVPLESFAADSVIVPQNAWEYMENANLAPGELQRFKDRFGVEQNDLSVIPCGRKTCNLETHICMKLVKAPVLSNLLSNGHIEKTLYVCIDRKDSTTIGIYQKKGYVEDTEGGLQSRIKYNKQKTQILKVKDKELKDKDCYKAVTETTENGEKTGTKNYCIKVIGKEVHVYTATSASGRTFFKCDVIPVRYYNNRECKFCQMIGFLYHSVDDITVKSYNALGKSFAIVLVVGLMVWLAMKTLTFVSSLTKQDAAKYITEIIQQSYKFIIAFFALVYYDDVFRLIIDPLLVAGLQFGKEFVEVESVAHRFDLPDSITSTLEVFKNPAKYGDALAVIPSEYNENTQNVFYSFKIFETMENFAYNVNLQYTLLQVIGGGLNCIGWKYLLWQVAGAGWELGLGIGCLIYGLAFSVFGFLLCLAFIFYLLDAVVQLGFVGALLPFLIASWPFKITSKYTSTGFKMLLNSIFTFILMGVVVKVSMELVNMAVDINTQTRGSDSETSSLALLVEALDTTNTERLKQMVNVLSVGFLIFLFANIMGFLLLARVSELTDRFASGGMKASAPAIATMGASAVKGIYMKASQPLREDVDDFLEETPRKAVQKVVGLFKRKGSSGSGAGGGAGGGSGGGSGGSGGGSGGSGGGSGGQSGQTENAPKKPVSVGDGKSANTENEKKLPDDKTEKPAPAAEDEKQQISDGDKPKQISEGEAKQPEEKKTDGNPVGEEGKTQSENPESPETKIGQEAPKKFQPEDGQAKQAQTTGEAAKPESEVTTPPDYGKPDYKAPDYKAPDYSHPQGSSGSTPDAAPKEAAGGQKGKKPDINRLDNLESRGSEADKRAPAAPQPENKPAEQSQKVDREVKQPQKADEKAQPETQGTTPPDYKTPDYGKPDYKAPDYKAPDYGRPQEDSNPKPDAAPKGTAGQAGKKPDFDKLDKLD